MNWKERIYCGELRPTHAGQNVLLMGWVDAIRDHGNLLFIHMRDVRGTVQVVFDPTFSSRSYTLAASLREEYVIQVKGRVSVRAAGTENPNLSTGGVEVFAGDLEILSESRTLPFPISEKAMVFGEELKSNPANVDEDLRLRYRYLDLRRPSMQECFQKRYQIVRTIRDYLHSLNFIEVETPFLTKSTPEGARDYLVPSRVHQGRFYALPQSPQLFKQLIMMAGMDRYFQIVKCFRDEDLRPNRQPEFTQLDMEASFIDEEFIYEIVEDLTVRIFNVGGIQLPRPFPRMTYQEAMERYGNDKPDLRFDMAFEEITDLVQDTRYTIFRQILGQGGIVKGFCVRGRADALSKNVLQNEYALKIAPEMGAKGMTWMKVVDGKLQSNIAQFFRPGELEGIRSRFNAGEGDVLVMIADTSRDLLNKVLSQLRLHMAERLGLIPADKYTPLWVTDFPLFEKKEDGIGSQHHPFTMPDRTDFDPKNLEELLSLKSRAYDLVMNGEELGGGSIRIHRMDIQQKIFESLGMGPEELESKFGFFLRALEYGAPPHGGLALGLDRVIAMILKMPSIRDVISFPKNRSAFCPLTEAPSLVDTCQMQELGLGSTPEDSRDDSPGSAGAAKVHRPVAQKRDRISMDEVKHVARLARLKVSNEEARAYQKELNAVLNHFEVLQSLDTRNVTPMSQVLKTANVWREDVPAEKEDTESLLESSPVREKNFYKVPRILEG
ncbi:MAG: Asp-tRNA(Asn)/Glu-tRNA(Gln) amidotransferase GatCAB subunit C [Deltaproteobacteria bacterium HGW-Deltaproteobacteria-21]|nr:MAG: Asp-tRNA(Asn)/Glu-tRNA(Gln) amidotransferase GatCAB subunit C [Deltaproteobacteria bacterium HGW-Deltaproteobacteria-21]